MKPDEFKEVKRPSKHALPGEGAWMKQGDHAPKMSKEFQDEARRLSHTIGRKDSKEAAQELAEKYEKEVQRARRVEEKKRERSLARRPSKEMTSEEMLPPDNSGDPLPLTTRKTSKNSQVSFVDEKEASPEKERVPIARERRSIREVLKDRPDGLAGDENSKFLQQRNLDPERFKDRTFLDDIFLCYDPNGDGTGSLGYREFSKLVKDLGLKLNKAEVEGMMNQLDLNGNGLIEIEEFHFFFNHATSRDDLKAHAQDMCGSQNMFVRKLFEEFGNQDGRGIDFEGLVEMSKVMGMDKGEHALDNKALRQFFRRMDPGKTGYVSQEKIEFFFNNVNARDELKEYLQHNSKDNTLMLQQVFQKFDSSGRGGMNCLDLLAAAQFLDYKISENGVQQLLEKVDADNNGTVEVDEFINFFAQVRNTEELMEELENFKKAKERQKYVYGGGWFVALSLIAFGIYMFFSATDTIQTAYGYAGMGVGGLIATMLSVPTLLPQLWDQFYHTFVRTCNASKAIQCGTLLVMLIGGLFIYQLVEPKNPYNTIIPIVLPVLAVPVVLMIVFGVIHSFADSAGFLEPVSDSDEEPGAKDGKRKGRTDSTLAHKYSVDMESGKAAPPKQAF